MSNLAGLPPLGLKKDRRKSKPQKQIPRMSKKKKLYMDSDERKSGLAHMANVSQLPCLACGVYSVEVHHEGKPRSDFNVLPLCPAHHRREYGPGSYHYSPKAFYTLHGSSADLLERVARLLAMR